MVVDKYRKKGERKEEARGPLTSFAEFLLPRFPDLRKKLILANLQKTPLKFLEQVIASAFFLSIGLLLITAVFFVRYEVWPVYFIVPLIIYPLIAFKYLMFYPDAMVVKRQKSIDYDIVFAGRHLVIALESGMPLFDGMVGLRTGYGEVSKEFDKIVEYVTLGTPLSQALREVSQFNPSRHFVRVLMQISNALSSGADIGNSLEAVLNQIAEEQKIQLKEYGQKLTPVVMFFMVFGIILPSIGVVLMTVLFSVVTAGDKGLTSYLLLLILAFITIVQLLFLGIVESSRPKYLV